MSCPSDPSVFVAPATERGRSGPAAGLEGACLHHAVATIQNRSCACLHQDPAATDTPSKTQRVRRLHHNVVALQSPGCGSPAPWAGEPDPGASTIRRRNPNGVEQNAVAHKTRPDSSAGWNGGGHGVTRSNGATSVLSHPVGVHARRRTHPQGSAPRLAAGGRTLGFGVPPRCGEES